MNYKNISIAIVTLSLAMGSCGKKNKTTVKTITTKSGIEMVYLPGGEFTMGGGSSPQSKPHRVKVSPFYIDKYEVTQEMFKKLELPSASHFKGSKKPVEMVSWVNAAIYCNERSIEEGFKPCYNEKTWNCDFKANGYRLPTEAEWEYAARGGKTGKFFFAGGEKKLSGYAIYKKNSGKETATIGSRKPNPYGLYDIYGNVAEWCNDKYSATYYGKAKRENPEGPETGEGRVVRGGSWNDVGKNINSFQRSHDDSVNDACILRDTIGFRCVRRAN